MSHVFVSFTLHFVCLSLPITTEDSAAEASSGCGQCKTWCIVLRVESSTRVMLWVLSVIISMKLRQGGISSVNWLDFLCDFYPAPAQVACAPLSTHNRHSDIYIALLRPNKLEMLIDLGRGRGISAGILNVLPNVLLASHFLGVTFIIIIGSPESYQCLRSSYLEKNHHVLRLPSSAPASHSSSLLAVHRTVTHCHSVTITHYIH